MEERREVKIFEEIEKAYLKAAFYYKKAADVEYEQEKKAELLEKAGDIYMLVLKYAKASEMFEEALEYNPSNTAILKKLGQSYFYYASTSEEKLSTLTKRELYLKAISAIQRYLIDFRADVDAWILLGKAYCKVGNYREGEQCYYRALEIEPTNYRAILNTAWYYEDLEQYEKAIEFYEKLCKISPERHHPPIYLAHLYRKIGDLDKAIEYLQKALEKTRESWGIWLNLASAYAEKGDYSKAIECARRAIEIKALRGEGESWEAWEQLEDYYAHLGDYENAKQCKERALMIKQSKRQRKG